MGSSPDTETGRGAPKRQGWNPPSQADVRDGGPADVHRLEAWESGPKRGDLTGGRPTGQVGSHCPLGLARVSGELSVRQGRALSCVPVVVGLRSYGLLAQPG